MRAGFLSFQVAILLAALLVIVGCSEKEETYYQGYVEGEFVYLASSRQGVLENLLVTRGQTVRLNDPVFQLDPNPEALQIEEMHHRIEQAKAKTADMKQGERPSELENIKSRLTKAQQALTLAKRDLKRREELYERGGSDAISKEELDRYKSEVDIRQADVVTIGAELKTARLGGRAFAVAASESEVNILDASLNQLKWQLAEKQVASPASGKIQDIIYRVGEFVPAGRPVLSLLPAENLKIRFFVPQSLLPKIQVGSAVRVKLDGVDSPIKANVSFISPQAEFTPPIIYSKESRTKLVFMIEAIPESNATGQLRVGQPAEIYID